MFDRYNRTARLAPAILAALPALVVLISAVSSSSATLHVGGVSGGCVGLVVIALVRDRGRRVQEHLWQGWGGPPATRRLRWREGTTTEVARLHERVERATGMKLPDATREQHDPAEADAHYSEAVAALRALTLDSGRFKLVFEENINYGWRRNSYGLRPVAIAIAAIAFVAAALVLAFAGGAFQDRASRWTPALAVSALALLWWTCLVTNSWVRSAAELYADRLFEATHVLAAPSQ